MYDPKILEAEISKLWEEKKIPEKIAKFSGKKKFYLLDGPPYANGRAHAGHALTITFKDAWGKFKTMQGHSVWWQPGFDCHGLPIENKVEKAIGVSSKSDLLEYGVDKFLKQCRDFATTNLTEWMKLYKQMAAWKGWVDPYFTYNDSYIESGWWTVKRLHDKGLLYRGSKPIHWCPHCETALSGYEVTDSYAEVEDPAIYVKFKLAKQDASILVWTTTPWTLPSNVALLVHPEEKYVKIEAGGEKLIMSKALLERTMEKTKARYKVLEEFQGKKLEGSRYEPLIDCPLQKELQKNENALRVYVSVPIMLKKVAAKVAEKKGIEARTEFGHLVTMDVGTGVVHIAPGHGEEDSKIGEHYKLPALSPLDDACKYTEGVGFKGFVKDADPEIIKYLEKHGKLFFKERIRHTYPLCWRCKNPLIFRLSSQWFLSVEMLKEKMLKANSQVRWLPEFAEERMHNHLAESPDWCLSTQRFWGIPLPIWLCQKCEKYEVLGSKKELQARAREKTELSDLHKNVVDKVELKCSCGGTMKRSPDVLNIWFDSGIGPWASLGYPHKNKELFEALWPVDLVNESQDMIRGWFYYLLLMGMATFDKKPFETACLNGWVLDAKGEKMSKSVGNVVDAQEMVDKLGADMLRLYICSASAPWGFYKFSFEEAKKLHAPINMLLNLKNFVDMYDLKLDVKGAAKAQPHRWIISRANSLVKDVTDDMENFRFHYASRKLIDFLVKDFSRTYMKFAKDLIKENPKEVSSTVGYVLHRYVRLLAPICPYAAEYIYQQLFSGESVHLEKWPAPEGKMVDVELEKDFAVLDSLTEAVLALRQEKNIGLRYPVKEAVVSGPPEMMKAIKKLSEPLMALSNLKSLKEGKSKVSYEIKPNYAVLGPRLGEDIKKLVKYLAVADSSSIVSKLIKTDSIDLEGFKLAKEDLKISIKLPEGGGKAFETPLGTGVVVLDTEETKEIYEESLVRELARAVQQERKERGLKIAQKISLHLKADAKTENILKKHEKNLKEKTGSSKVTYGSGSKECAFRDVKIYFDVVV